MATRHLDLLLRPGQLHRPLRGGIPLRIHRVPAHHAMLPDGGNGATFAGKLTNLFDEKELCRSFYIYFTRTPTKSAARERLLAKTRESW